ncbi:hypothetical protein ACTXT7_008707 [Hymenolepis weldensis]
MNPNNFGNSSTESPPDLDDSVNSESSINDMIPELGNNTRTLMEVEKPPSLQLKIANVKSSDNFEGKTTKPPTNISGNNTSESNSSNNLSGGSGDNSPENVLTPPPMNMNNSITDSKPESDQCTTDP